MKGFHEARLESFHVATDYRGVENLASLAKKVVQKLLKHGQR